MTKSYHTLNWYQSGLRFFQLMFLALLMVLLVGCPAQSTKQLDFDASKSSSYYLSQADANSGKDKINWQLLAIQAFIIEDSLLQANQLIQQLPLDLNGQQQIEKLLSQGEIAAKRQQSFNIASLSFSELNDNQKIRYLKIKIALNAKRQDSNEQIRDYIELEKYGTAKQQHAAINDTWNFLISLNEIQINSILVYANEPTLQGWIDLIYAYRNNNDVYIVEEDDDLETANRKEEAQFNLLKRAVDEWQMQYSNHPAALYLPRNIYGEKYRLPENDNNKNIALFLPLSGSSRVFGDVIRLGYADGAKFYPEDPQQNIYVFDTDSNPLDVLVQQAKQQGAELIVGPLLKENVAAITKLSPSIPVLALNRVDNNMYSTNVDSTICYFSLSPEDEAKDAAQHIVNQHKTNPLLIVPQNDLGQRVVNSFAQQWRLSNNRADIHVQYFQSAKSLSENMNKGIGIELEGELISNNSWEQEISEAPESADPLTTQLNELIADYNSEAETDIASQTEIEVKPEFDAIYVFASHEELTLIKSMLDMKSNIVEIDENGQETPINKVIPAIYTSSRSNIAETTQDFRYDMDRVQFSEIPMIVNQSQLLEQLPSYIKNDYSLVRLYALGVDAWRLANRFNELEPYQIDILNGMTGQLSVDSQCEITRTLTWKQYRNGKERPVK